MFDMNPEDTLSATQMDHLAEVSRQAEVLNATVRRAVEAGLSVEMQRAERHHCGAGCWGDLMRPVVVKCR